MATDHAATTQNHVRRELLEASDETIEDAITYADPMLLRGLIFQLTGDEEVAATKLATIQAGFAELQVPASEEDLNLLRRKAVEFVKAYRDSGAGSIDIGPPERLPTSLRLAAGDEIPENEMGLHLEDLALDPWARSLAWSEPPPAERIADFSVTIIGAGMGGLNAAVQLQRAGIRYQVIEKNSGVGGTWFENRYPGARVDVPSRSYTHLFGVDFDYPGAFCSWPENQRYFDWVADTFDLRERITFDTEVKAMVWDEDASVWKLTVEGPEGQRTIRSNAVITAVGFLNRPMIPEIEGMLEFQGVSCHSARWPDGLELAGKRVAVIGTGCSGIQMIPEIALEAEHVSVFMRTPQWLFDIQGYRSLFPPQVTWLDRNVPFHTNFTRFRASYAVRALGTNSEIDPTFHEDPNAVSRTNKRLRDGCIAFLQSKLQDPELIEAMIPPHPVLSARPVLVDPEYSVLDVIQQDNLTLVTDGIERINETGIQSLDGRQHDVDVIVYATGFHATEYLFPMTIKGRDGKLVEELWADGGARAYLGCMIPGMPNLWTIYGPNTNGGLTVAGFHELITLYALQCIERLILNDKRSVEVRDEAYWRYNAIVDQRNANKAWSDPRAHNYYWTQHGRSAVMCPFEPGEMWRFLRHPDFNDLAMD